MDECARHFNEHISGDTMADATTPSVGIGMHRLLHRNMQLSCEFPSSFDSFLLPFSFHLHLLTFRKHGRSTGSQAC